MITRDRASEIMNGFEGSKVLVVGDVMLDRYVTGQVDRISPEAPVPVVCVKDEHCRPGGAANVAKNIMSFGGQVVLAGVSGNDREGDDLDELLTSAGVDVSGIVRSDDDRTIVKTRVLADRQQIVRVDRERGNSGKEAAEKELCERLPGIIRGIQGVIVEDYGKGVVTQELLDTVVSAASEAGIPVGMDPKYGHDLDVSGIRMATPNYREACSAAGLPDVVDCDEVTVLKVGERLLDLWKVEMLLVTLGPMGMCMLKKGSDPEFIPTRAREVFDVSGAGDTVISAAMLAISSGAGDYEAAAIANYAAGVVVAKVGTATCSPAELLESIEE